MLYVKVLETLVTLGITGTEDYNRRGPDVSDQSELQVRVSRGRDLSGLGFSSCAALPHGLLSQFTGGCNGVGYEE